MMGFWYTPPQWRKGLGLVVIGLLGTPAIALAHGAHIQSRTAPAVEIQARYDSGEPMAEAQVQVYSPEDPQTPAFSGLTDETGRYVFVPDQPGDWEVSVRQAGHGDITVISVGEAGAVASAPDATGDIDAGDPAEATDSPVAIVPTSAEMGFEGPAGLSPLQRGIVAGAVTWGCVGTALYFRRGKR